MADVVGSFFMGQHIALKGTIGTMEGEIKTLKSENIALDALRASLVQALEEVAPDHPLAKQENRYEIYKKAWWATRS